MKLKIAVFALIPSASAENDDAGKAGGFRQHAEGETQIRQKGFDQRQPHLREVLFPDSSTGPNLRMAWRCASAGGRPARTYSAVCRARCSSTSSFNLRSLRRRATTLAKRVKNRFRDFGENPPPSPQRTAL